MANARLVSFGQYLPERIVTNAELEGLLNTSDEWIQQRSGIKERRWVQPHETTLFMATQAAREALKTANRSPDDVDLIIFGCLISDYVFPGTGCLLQKELGFKKPIPSLDIRNQCTGFLYALSIANAFIKAGVYKSILIVASEIHSPRLDKTPRGRDVSVLFGDGAGACLVEATTDSSGVLDVHLASQGEFADTLCVKGPGSAFDWQRDFVSKDEVQFYPHMEGRLVFKNAIERMTESLRETMSRNKVQNSQIDFVIAHQANMRINAMVLEQMQIPWEKTHHTLDRYGNTTMATIPITMNEAVQKGKIKRGDLVALVAFGAGFTWGSALVRY